MQHQTGLYEAAVPSLRVSPRGRRSRTLTVTRARSRARSQALLALGVYLALSIVLIGRFALTHPALSGPG